MSADVLLIDNVDSFTYNIADLLHRVLGRQPVVWRNDHAASEQDLQRFAAIVVGPGPGRPQVDADLGLSRLALTQQSIPVLGICLGHQGIAHLAGAQVGQMSIPRHGIVSPVEHDGTGLFEGVPNPVEAVRYHSLEALEPLGSGLQVTARAVDDGCVMGLADHAGRRWGLQFHPESVLSAHGATMLANFLRLAGVTPSALDDTQLVAVGDALTPHRPRRGARPVTIRVCRIPGPVDDWTIRQELVGDSPTSAWLDSSDGSGWSVLVDSSGPLSYELTHRVGEHDQVLLDRLDEHLGRLRLSGDLPEVPFTWRPGFVGYWGYELKAETGGAAAHRSPWPDAWLTFADRGLVLDHRSGDAFALWLDDPSDPQVGRAQRSWVSGVQQAVALSRPSRSRPSSFGPSSFGPSSSGQPGPDADGGTSGPAPGQPTQTQPETETQSRTQTQTQTGTHVSRRAAPVPRDDEAAYLDKVRRAQREIARGESYEICLTTTFEADTDLDETALYQAMRQVSPVPHGAWLRTPEVSLLGCSPERFVSIDGAGVVEARPIKGTRPRGATPDEDTALAADLVSAVKDRAENLMIVDLLRNDLHRVCRSGSVHVPEIFAVETYATVHQLVSTVRGRLAEGMGPTDVLRACFPGGSMTGAPKVRTMELLDDLEDGPRGIYSGAIGWIGLDGSMDTSIVIRAATYAQGRVTFGVGGAVTALSDADEEYVETLTKARSVLAAMRLAGAGSDQATGPRPQAQSG